MVETQKKKRKEKKRGGITTTDIWNTIRLENDAQFYLHQWIRDRPILSLDVTSVCIGVGLTRPTDHKESFAAE